MSDTVRVNTVLSSDLLQRVEAYAQAKYEDRSTAIRQLLDFALRELALQQALEAYTQGRVTLREFATTLGLDYWKAQDVLAVNGVAIAQGTIAETAPAVEKVRRRLGDASKAAKSEKRSKPKAS